MKKSFKKAAVLMLTGAMLMGSLAGCGKKKEGETTTPTSAPTAAADKATAAPTTAAPDTTITEVAGIEGWKAFDKQIEITVPVFDRSKEGYPAVDDNYWTQWVQKEFGDKYNVKVTYVPITRGGEMTAYSLLIAGGKTPTILMEYDYPKLTTWANDGAMTVLDLDAFKQVAPNYYNKMVENNQLGYTDINGETFFVLSERAYYNTTYTHATFVRMDWLRQVGYDHVPTSYAEQVDATNKIIAAGLTDQAPMDLSLPTTGYIQNYGFRNFPVDELEWAMHSSLGTPSFTWEPSYKLLKRQNAEYNMGWYSKEYDLDSDGSGGATGSQQKSDFINGKIYRFGGYMSANVDWLTAFYEQNPNGELAIQSLYCSVEPGVMDHPQIRADNPFGMIVGFSSLATDDQLKAAWMLMEWMLQPDILFTLENGIEGVTYTLDANGNPVVNGDYRGPEMLNHNANIDMTCLVHAVQTRGTIEQTIAGISPQGLPQDFTQDLINNYYELKKVADNGWAYTDPIFAVSLEEESEYSKTLLSLYQEYSVKLVKCKPEEFDAIYDDLSKKYLSAGYQEIIDARKKAYEAGQTTKLPK